MGPNGRGDLCVAAPGAAKPMLYSGMRSPAGGETANKSRREQLVEENHRFR
jgi:hypothetical protein